MIESQELAEERVRRCTEMLQNIKCLKLYSWEAVATNQVLKSRKRQIEAMKKASLIRSVSSWLCYSYNSINANTTYYYIYQV